MKFRNKYVPSASFFEELSDELITVPDGSLSIQEILRRQVNGLPLPRGCVKDVYYSPDFVPPYLRKGFDLADVKQVINDGNKAKKQLQSEVEDQITSARLAQSIEEKSSSD